jgi:hypothetical protein
MYSYNIISIKMFMILCGIFIFIVTAVVAFFVDEVNPIKDDDVDFLTMLKTFKGFLVNKNL